MLLEVRQRLLEERQKVMVQAMTNAISHDAVPYEFGRARGVYIGLSAAIEVIDAALAPPAKEEDAA